MLIKINFLPQWAPFFWPLKRTVLLLARPYQLRGKVRIVIQPLLRLHRRYRNVVFISLVRRSNWISFRSHQPDRRVVSPFLVRMLVMFDGTFSGWSTGLLLS